MREGGEDGVEDVRQLGRGRGDDGGAEGGRVRGGERGEAAAQRDAVRDHAQRVGALLRLDLLHRFVLFRVFLALLKLHNLVVHIVQFVVHFI